jgi:hypothetical protein
MLTRTRNVSGSGLGGSVRDGGSVWLDASLPWLRRSGIPTSGRVPSPGGRSISIVPPSPRHDRGARSARCLGLGRFPDSVMAKRKAECALLRSESATNTRVAAACLHALVSASETMYYAATSIRAG